MTIPHRDTASTPHLAETLKGPGRLILAGRDLTQAEAHGLVARGLLAHVLREVYSTVPPNPQVRAAAVAHYLKPHSQRVAIIHRLTAAWIYGCAVAPFYVECSVNGRSAHRFGADEIRYIRHRFMRYSPYDDLRIGDVRVTTPLRTCVDLAVHDPGARGDAALATMLRATDLGCPPQTVCLALNALPRLKFRQHAVQRVLRLGPPPDSAATPTAEASAANR
ncbi:hypothetical protein [Curtobacterium sp. S6]|uniref:hypothetical protein n=1 Tax=Curtobacterium sp. S6 TaxID=1479623 RepID=UPI0004AA6526|nr:hypothetical protein [Curtobacterium sp. S6]